MCLFSTPCKRTPVPSSPIPQVRTHMVGMGSKLNPHGVFVVERPGLTQFLTSLSTWAEVIVYTAGEPGVKMRRMHPGLPCVCTPIYSTLRPRHILDHLPAL